MAYNPQDKNGYYNAFKSKEIVFNKDVIKSIGLNVNKVILKCGSTSLPCILYQSSFQNAKILLEAPPLFFQTVKKMNNVLSLRLAFINLESGKPISIFIHTKLSRYTPYNSVKPNIFVLSLEYINKPPDDFITTIGKYLEKLDCNEKRMQQRIVISEKNQTNFGLQPMETFLFTEGKGKKCILTEISIFSAKVLIHGIPHDYMKKKVLLLMKAEALKEMGEMVGEVVRYEYLNEDKNFMSLIVVFDQETIPPKYKMWVGQCLEAIKLNQYK